MNKKIELLFILVVMLCPLWVFANSVITTGHLIEELTDISQLTEFPDVNYKLVQFSSFDRRSVHRLHTD
ncbi:MAG: hypothetical protein ACP5KS_13785, partial [Candidatus Hydrogenedens sp.]